MLDLDIVEAGRAEFLQIGLADAARREGQLGDVIEQCSFSLG